MRRWVKKLLVAAGLGVGATVLILTFLAYFVRRVDLATGSFHDGLGRNLMTTPDWASILLSNEPMWAGYGWFFVDLAGFWGGMGIAYLLISIGAPRAV